MVTQKQQLILNRPSPRAVRLANDIYFTYLYEEDTSLRLSLPRLCEVFGNSDIGVVKNMVIETFEELNEPIVLKQCSFRGKRVEWMVLNFFTYLFCVNDGCEYIELEVNELYLEALEILDEAPYINFQ